jgi:hypothetical protein
LATSARTNGFSRVKPSTRSSPAAANHGKNGTKPAGRPVASVGRPAVSANRPAVSVTAGGNGRAIVGKPAAKPEAKILFQKYFHSVGPRTYAAQVKELGNGNHLLVLTEGKRDPDNGEVKKTRLLIFGEDFSAFFKLLHETATFIRANPLSDEMKEKRSKFWAKKNKEAKNANRPTVE